MRAPLSNQSVASAFRDACFAELDALKPGNVHRFRDDDTRMTVADFEASARAAAPALAMPMISAGVRIRLAVEATIGVVGQNTNLGIILLSAPLAQAALHGGEGDLRARLARVLAGLDIEDAREAYAAIRHATPGGLGQALRHDVGAEPHVTLLEAMRAAEDRDRIAWNYTHGFADIFERGVPCLEVARARGLAPSFATTSVYLGFLASIPDTLIARKFGKDQAEAVMAEARALAESPESTGYEALMPKLLAFDRSLKKKALNPGTTADLTVATLFAAALQAPEASAI